MAIWNNMKVEITKPRDAQGWVAGKIGSYRFEAKVYDEGSKYGINKGRVSKLAIWNPETIKQIGFFEACLMNYDRGWDIRPEKNAKVYFEQVLKTLENLPTA